MTKWHEPTEPTTNERGDEIHPAWGLISANRVQSTPGATLFDSDIRHQHSVVVQIATASRHRDLSHDWLSREDEFVEIQMSEAQWASFVSSMNAGQGVPCTIRRREDDINIPGVAYAPRLQESMDEVRNAADKAVAEVAAAYDAVEQAFEAKAGRKELREKISTLKYAVANMPANVEFTAKSLTEHTENVVQKARADLEAMVVNKAKQLGVGEDEVRELMPGDAL